MHTCDVCNRSFPSMAAVYQHNKSALHHACEYCHKATATPDGLQQHYNAVHGNSDNKCPQCSRSFNFISALAEHQKRHGHCYCGDCAKAFGSSEALQSHLQSSRHSTEFRCCDCDRNFKSSAALEQHLAHKVHKVPTPPSRTQKEPPRNTSAQDEQGLFTCSQCPRQFRSAEALNQHSASPIHTLPCIGSTSCKKRFKVPSAALHHLESGACPSGMDYGKLRTLIVEHDTDRLITTRAEQKLQTMLIGVNQQLLLTKQTKADTSTILSESGEFVQTPSSGNTTPSSFHSQGTSQGAWTPADGDISDWALAVSQCQKSRRCPFCPTKNRLFQTSKALQDHLKSSTAHASPFVFCPTEKGKAPRAFTSAGSLAQHLESGACHGGSGKFWDLVGYLEKRLSALGLDSTWTASIT